MKRLSTFWDLYWYNKYFHNQKNTKNIIALINRIGNHGVPKSLRSEANDNLDDILNNGYLRQNEIQLLRENRKFTIKEFKDLQRKSAKNEPDELNKRPYSLHSFSVEYILSQINARSDIRFAGMNHDNLEEINKLETHSSIDDLANHYVNIQERINSAFKKGIWDTSGFSPKYKLGICVMLHKVTRL